MNKEKKVIIIGAGISGLTAAIELERNGFTPTMIESTDRVGGRVKTDYENGYQFDHGFQVLLTAYPEASKYLDLEALNLRNFKPGAEIYASANPFLIIDPLRQPSAIFSTLRSPVGSFVDKWKMWKLTNELKKKTITEIFKASSTSTMEYLKGYGFSQTIIDNFFQPFFSGIFLEKELDTSSRMFQFIFKMFAEGYAAIPNKGMQAIPDQLRDQLQHTEIIYDCIVESISDKVISTSKGDYAFDFTILASPPNKILPNYSGESIIYRSTTNLYFSIPNRNGAAYIGLLPAGNGLVNNFCILTNVSDKYALDNKSLLSVTIVGPTEIAHHKLIEKVTEELSSILDLNKSEFHFLKEYNIEQALPKVALPTLELLKPQVCYNECIYLAGDYLLGGSLNAAMSSGRQTVEMMIEDMKI